MIDLNDDCSFSVNRILVNFLHKFVMAPLETIAGLINTRNDEAPPDCTHGTLVQLF